MKLFGKKSNVALFTIPDVAKHYVLNNNNDYSSVDEDVTKNERVISFLREEKNEKFSNEKNIFDDKIAELIDRNKNLKALKKGYKKIDLSFLSMKRKQSKNSKLPYHPVFSYHEYGHKSFFPCRVEINIRVSQTDIWLLPCTKIHNIPMILVQNFIKVFSDRVVKQQFSINRGKVLYTSKVDLFPEMKKSVILSNNFAGVIPTSTKQKVQDATKFFENGHIFLIKECPKWEEEEITVDPLVIGIIGNQAYLIDHFDCTTMEKYISKEFTY